MNPPPLPVRKRFPWILYWIVLVLISLVTFAPVGSVHPCVVNGKDYGPLLYQLGVMGWLMLVTLPAGALAFATWLIVLVLHRSAWRKRAANLW